MTKKHSEKNAMTKADLMLLWGKGGTGSRHRRLRPSLRGGQVVKSEAKKKQHQKQRTAAELLAEKQRKKEIQDEANQRRKLLHEERKRLGLTATDGFVKASTKVLQSTLIKNSVFRESVLFRKPPFALEMSVPIALIEELKEIEDLILKSAIANRHRYGANMGVNAGISVVTGGGYCSKAKQSVSGQGSMSEVQPLESSVGNPSDFGLSESGMDSEQLMDAANEGLGTIDVGGVLVADDDPETRVSGSIHCARVLKSDPELRNRLYDCIRRIMYTAFSKEKWFKAQVMLAARLNKESGEERTIPGLPFSALWLTQNPNEDKVHIDENVVGATVVLTTSHFKGSELVLMNDEGVKYHVQLEPGKLVAGRWAQNPHCNTKVITAEFRTSWTFYLDYRVFFRNYVWVKPSGYVA